MRKSGRGKLNIGGSGTNHLKRSGVDNASQERGYVAENSFADALRKRRKLEERMMNQGADQQTVDKYRTNQKTFQKMNNGNGKGRSRKNHNGGTG